MIRALVFLIVGGLAYYILNIVFTTLITGTTSTDTLVTTLVPLGLALGLAIASILLPLKAVLGKKQSGF